jgi:hypothetical protein
MSVYIAGERMGMFGFPGFSHWMPELGGPEREGIGETFGPISISDLRQKGFYVAIAIGTRSSGEQRQAIGGIPTQIPRAL